MHHTGGVVVAGSNPAVPTIFSLVAQSSDGCHNRRYKLPHRASQSLCRVCLRRALSCRDPTGIVRGCVTGATFFGLNHVSRRAYGRFKLCAHAAFLSKPRTIVAMPNPLRGVFTLPSAEACLSACPRGHGSTLGPETSSEGRFASSLRAAGPALC